MGSLPYDAAYQRGAAALMTKTQHAYPGGLYTTTNITVSGVGREGANNEGLEKEASMVRGGDSVVGHSR